MPGLLAKALWTLSAFAIVSRAANAPFHKPAAIIESYAHPSVPGYSLDITDPTKLGVDPSVGQQAGYLNTPSGDQLFYWFFESRSSPSTDPVLIWLNGGPGCSSLEAILFENGPATIDQAGKLTSNQWSWNGHANILYIDNPAGAGYSTGRFVHDTNTAAGDFKNALKLFYERNKDLVGKLPFHLSGESYAGRYIPVFAEAVNTDPNASVKISSIMIGNGLVNAEAEYDSYQPMLCGQGGYASVLNNFECERMSQQTRGCANAIESCTNEEQSQSGPSEAFCWYDAETRCAALQSYLNGLNPYDIRDRSCPQTTTGLCYPGLDWVQDYFNSAAVKQALGVSTSLDYAVCNSTINRAFNQGFDGFQPTYENVTRLLESGVPVLVYNGGADIILNWLGGRQWTSELSWSGQQGFQAAGQQPKSWAPVGSQVRGIATNYQHFTFLRVDGAGHMVPHDQPESAYYMANQWLRGDYGLTSKL